MARQRVLRCLALMALPPLPADELGGSGDPTLEALARFQVANESRFRGRVLNDCIPQQHAAVGGGGGPGGIGASKGRTQGCC